jgi:hypothetical protein
VTRRTTVSDLQRRSWSFYGTPGLDGEAHAVGEVRYVVGWHADQMTRLDWDVLIDGSDDWEVTIGTGDEAETVTSRVGTGEDGQPEIDVTEASRQLLELIDWNDTNIRAVDTNLFVAGEGHYAQVTNDDQWAVISTVEKDAQKKLEASVQAVPFIWSHPADRTRPDAPLFAVLDLLDELDWLNRQARTQSRQRVLINGIVVTADGFVGPNGSDWWDVWNETLSARMRDPEDMSPVRLSGPGDLVKDGVNWLVPPFGYDDVLDRRVLAAIHRLAFGLPVPPEILLGMQAQSRATAFQVEENAYRAHIEPPALMVAQVAQDALGLLIKDKEVTVVPNPSRLLARRNSVQDVKDAYDRGLVTPEYVREVLGIPDDAAPEEDMDGVPPNSGVPDAETDPSNVAAREASPITAAATETTDLSTLLSDIDAALSSELAGVTVMATDRARQRLGGAARNNPTIRDIPDQKKLTSSQLAVKLGFDGLEAAGVDVAERIAEPIDAASRWWVKRVGEVWTQVSTLVPGWAGQGDWVTESVDALADSLADHIISTLSEPEPAPLNAGSLRLVLDLSAGDKVA